MAKHIVSRPDWLEAEGVKDICSVSGCISEYFTDYIEYWRHNGYWLFNAPEVIQSIVQESSIDIAETKLFFYEAYEFQYDSDDKIWTPFEPEKSFLTDICEPENKVLGGYDVATFFGQSKPECSPLSCNSLACEIETNEHCLLPSLDRAKELLEEGKFDNCERGPFRILAVYFVPWNVD